MSLEEFIQTIGLRTMTEICDFHLATSSSTWEFIPSIIDSITSCEIRRITICVHMGYADDNVRLEPDLWVNIPAILERPNFQRLSKLVIAMGGDPNKCAKASGWVLEQLRDLAPGILDVILSMGE